MRWAAAGDGGTGTGQPASLWPGSRRCEQRCEGRLTVASLGPDPVSAMAVRGLPCRHDARLQGGGARSSGSRTAPLVCQLELRVLAPMARVSINTSGHMLAQHTGLAFQ